MSGAPEKLDRGATRLRLLLILVTALCVTLGALAGCHRHDDSDPAPPPAVSAPPTDRLAPGELVPGDKTAFSIVLPKDVTINQTFTDAVFASGPVSASDLANYVRARIREGTVSVGATATVFDKVKPQGDPKLTLSIRINSGPMGRGARIELRNVTPPPLPDLPSTADRWKQFGLSPDGKQLDPQHLR
jgi:hypothetical protein